MKYTTKPCPVCGQTSTAWVESKDLARWQGGELIQNVWPKMRPDDREVFISGTHPACWDKMFGGDDE